MLVNVCNPNPSSSLVNVDGAVMKPVQAKIVDL